eukprot:scaffold47397_cov59-Phaeocystis_antarctica.AAC.1
MRGQVRLAGCSRRADLHTPSPCCPPPHPHPPPRPNCHPHQAADALSHVPGLPRRVDDRRGGRQDCPLFFWGGRRVGGGGPLPPPERRQRVGAQQPHDAAAYGAAARAPRHRTRRRVVRARRAQSVAKGAGQGGWLYTRPSLSAAPRPPTCRRGVKLPYGPKQC